MRLSCRFARTLCTKAGLLVAVLVHCAGALIAEPLSPDPLELPSVWVKSFDSRAWSGYKDNVLLANRHITDSPLLGVGFDTSLFRLPIDQWEFLLFGSAEYTRYPGAPEVDQEATAVVQAQATRAFGDGWKAGLSAEYVYFNQVFDASIFEDSLRAIQVEANGMSLRPSIRKQLSQSSKLELELVVTRQLFFDLIDNYWEFGPRLSFGKKVSSKGEVEFAYQFADRRHDTRRSREQDGTLQPGRSLEYYQHEFFGTWRQVWDPEQRWRTSTKLSLRYNLDNGGGFYNYVRPQLSEQIRFRSSGWDIRLETRLSYYQYENERVPTPDLPLREKTYFGLTFRGERALTKSWKLFAQYDFEKAVSNVSLDAYQVNSIMTGVEWGF